MSRSNFETLLKNQFNGRKVIKKRFFSCERKKLTFV